MTESPPPDPSATFDPEPRWRSLVRTVSTSMSLALCILVSVAYAGRFDECAAITVFPVWAWFTAGLALLALCLRRRGNRWIIVVTLAWLVFLLEFAEEPWSLARLASRNPVKDRTGVLRVVSLNANIGDRRVVEEVAAQQPDIVLLQESPSRTTIDALAKSLFGDKAGVVYGVDASLITRGRLVPAELPIELRGYFVQARVRLPSGRDVEVFCTRLAPAAFRLDLWSPACWREQTENRRKRRQQLSKLVNRIEAVPEAVPVILGGDFNAPQGDAVFRLLEPRLVDTFRKAGRGWGNTITNGAPSLRIDQVWVSERLRPLSVIARKSKHSDHRIVICDLAL